MRIQEVKEKKLVPVPAKPSILSRYVLYFIYDWIVLFYPQWLVPNDITLFGCFCTLLASLLLFAAMPSRYGNITSIENIPSLEAPGMYNHPISLFPNSIRDCYSSLIEGSKSFNNDRIAFYSTLEDPRLRLKNTWAYFLNNTNMFGAADRVRHHFLKGNFDKYFMTRFFSGESLKLNKMDISKFLSLNTDPGRILIIIAGILNLIYCVADNTDGRQARRTHQTSFLGEYLDHGLDCITSLLSTMLLICIFGGDAYLGAAGLFVVATGVHFSHVLHQEKLIMVWGNELVSVDEAMVGFGLGFILVGIFPELTTKMLPVGKILSLLHISTESIPKCFFNVTFFEFLYPFFLLSQLQVNLDIISKNVSMLWRFTTIAFILNAAMFIGLTNNIRSFELIRTAKSNNYIVNFVIHGFRVVDEMFSLLMPFEAFWTIAAATCCSIIVHSHIVAKCLRIPQGVEIWPIVLFLPLVWFIFFFISSPLGALAGAAFHTAHVLYNIKCISNEFKKQ